ncbi:MAG: fasciclin domain-containing protein [Bacteroidaceae bacterium]|nr:fasciclin domain-containing protein [Bacteroidaceae bacterium]
MFKHKILVALAAVATLFASYSCEDNDVYVFPEPSDSELTLLSVMQRDPDYANFLEVVDKCGCLDSLLNQPRVYTVWAPINSAVDKDALIEQIENGERETVFQQFVKYHISNFRHPANGTLENNSLLMLNGKYVAFVGDAENGYTYGGREVVETNIHAKNGIIHKISTAVEYKPSVWEMLKSVNIISSFWDFCESFTIKDIDHNNSIPGPIVNQKPTYLDTLYVESNEILNFGNLGPIDNEDSTYIVYVPTTEVWNEITAEAANYFRFNTEEFTEEQKIEADSLTQVRGAKEYLRYLTYSMTEQEFADKVIDFDNLPDSLIAMYRDNPRKKVATADLVYNEVYETSNGQLRVLDKMPFKPTDLWHDTIRIEADKVNNVRQDESEAYVQRGTFTSVPVDEREQNEIYEGEVSAHSYLLAQADGSILPSRTFFARDVLSAKYKIAVIAIPEDILTKGDGVTNKNQSALMFTVSQSGSVMAEFPDPSLKVALRNGGEGYMPADAIRPDKAAIDTIFLCDAETGEPHIFDFQYCEKFNGFTTKSFENKHYTVEVTVSGAKLAGTKMGNSYLQSTAVDNNFRIDAILLIPVEDEEESAETESMQ